MIISEENGCKYQNYSLEIIELIQNQSAPIKYLLVFRYRHIFLFEKIVPPKGRTMLEVAAEQFPLLRKKVRKHYTDITKAIDRTYDLLKDSQK